MPFSGVARWLACLPIIGWCLQRHPSSRRVTSHQGSDHAPADDQKPAARLPAADRIDSPARHTEHAVLASSSNHAAPAAVPVAGVHLTAGSHQALSADLDSCSPDEQDSSSPCSAVDVQVVPLDAVQAAGSSPAKQLPQPGPGSALANNNESSQNSSQDSSSPAPAPACGTTLAAGALLSTSRAPCSPSKHTSPVCLSCSSSSPPQQDSSTADASHAPPAPVHLEPAAAAAQSVAAAEGSEFTTAAAAAPAVRGPAPATGNPKFSLPPKWDQHPAWKPQLASLHTCNALPTRGMLLRCALYPVHAVAAIKTPLGERYLTLHRPHGTKFKRLLRPEDRAKFTAELWGYRVLWAGMWRAVQAAAGPKGCLELNEATVEDLVKFTWASYRQLGPNEVRPAGSEEAPDFVVEHDVAGVASDGQVVTYFQPDFIHGMEDLKKKVLGGEGAGWLLRRYTELSAEKMASGTAKLRTLIYTFLKVDNSQEGGPLLLVDTDELPARVMKWAHRASADLEKAP